MTVNALIHCINNIERLSPFNDKEKSSRGWQLRTIQLLLAIMKEEGENQAYYREKFGWTFTAVGGHTKTLDEYGFLMFGDDERDPRGQSKRIYLVKGAKEHLIKSLNIDE